MQYAQISEKRTAVTDGGATKAKEKGGIYRP